MKKKFSRYSYVLYVSPSMCIFLELLHKVKLDKKFHSSFKGPHYPLKKNWSLLCPFHSLDTFGNPILLLTLFFLVSVILESSTSLLTTAKFPLVGMLSCFLADNYRHYPFFFVLPFSFKYCLGSILIFIPIHKNADPQFVVLPLAYFLSSNISK